MWRALYFQPGPLVNDAEQSAEWNRGAYLVQGLGHCNACHGSRNALGATSGTLDLSGGLIPMQNWYAPSLSDPHEAGVAGWETQQVVELLKNGVTRGASVLGPMAEVVNGSTQHLSDADLRAMASYLKGLPPARDERAQTASPVSEMASSRGAKLYEQHCVSCHGDKGAGVPGAYPALAGNRAVTMKSPVNLVRVVLEGGFAPSTAGNPRPYGMPPFATTLNDEDTAALLTFVRTAWGNQSTSVSALEVSKYRGTAR
jgi:mono/diheme cytochrome c family protein